jgi:hypothetical protein
VSALSDATTEAEGATELIIALTFHGDSEPSITLMGQTDRERAILAFLTEGHERRWKSSPHFGYRPGSVDRVDLVVDPESLREKPKDGGN